MTNNVINGLGGTICSLVVLQATTVTTIVQTVVNLTLSLIIGTIGSLITHWIQKKVNKAK